MVIDSQRLILRPYKDSDVKDLIEGLNNIEVSKWLAKIPFPYTESDANEFIKKSKDNDENKRIALAIVLKENNKVIGGTEICDINTKDGTASGGIWLNEKYQNNGYGMEAFSAKIKYCFEKLGFKIEGIRRKKYLCLATNEYKDEYITALLKDDFIEWGKKDIDSNST